MSQPRRMVEKGPGKRESLGDVLRQGPHAERLGEIMAAVIHVDVQLFGIEVGPMSTFARHVRVETRRGSVRDQRTPSPRDDPHAAHLGGAERPKALCISDSFP